MRLSSEHSGGCYILQPAVLSSLIQLDIGKMETKTKVKFRLIPKDIGDYITYSEESSTGLINKVSRGSRSIKGKEIGNIDRGYFKFKFRGQMYVNHRAIYFLNTGVDPEEKTVDHEDGNGLNNKISNLRLATHKQNQDNRKKSKNNSSGVTGVIWVKLSKKWRAEIYKDRSRIYLGLFDNKDEAVAVRIAAETDPRFKDQEYRDDHNDQYKLSPEMLEWAKEYLEDKIERLSWKEKYNLQ